MYVASLVNSPDSSLHSLSWPLSPSFPQVPQESGVLTLTELISLSCTTQFFTRTLEIKDSSTRVRSRNSGGTGPQYSWFARASGGNFERSRKPEHSLQILRVIELEVLITPEGCKRTSWKRPGVNGTGRDEPTNLYCSCGALRRDKEISASGYPPSKLSKNKPAHTAQTPFWRELLDISCLNRCIQSFLVWLLATCGQQAWMSSAIRLLARCLWNWSLTRWQTRSDARRIRFSSDTWVVKAFWKVCMFSTVGRGMCLAIKIRRSMRGPKWRMSDQWRTTREKCDGEMEASDVCVVRSVTDYPIIKRYRDGISSAPANAERIITTALTSPRRAWPSCAGRPPEDPSVHVSHLRVYGCWRGTSRLSSGLR